MKKIAIFSVILIGGSSLMAQSAMDGFQFSQDDMRGTARFMSMAGAFGALGGDLSVLSQNPGGIGIYRSTELGFTLDLDIQRNISKSFGISEGVNQTNFYLNNIGGIATLNLHNNTLQNLNFGFTYNKAASFNRKYQGSIATLNNSLSNYIAGVANANYLTEADVESTSTYDPYNPNDGGYVSPWITILGYDSYLITPLGNPDDPTWVGQWGNGTSGRGYFQVWEKGSADEFNFAFGGNISNILYWGMDFGVFNFNYTRESLWGESLTNAYVPGNSGLEQTTANWDLYNYQHVNGNGFNYKLGIIVKPIQELRIGFAFHTPTWYNFNETFYGRVDYRYDNSIRSGNAMTNNGYDAYNSYSFRTPWKFIASVAGVVGSKLIISADYQWESYSQMHFSAPTDYYDYGWDWYPYASQSMLNYDPYGDTNLDVKNYYKTSSTFRIGAEYRVTPQFSVRAGYSVSTSPVKEEAKNGNIDIYTAGTQPSFIWLDGTQYITAGIGYKYKHMSFDLAYVYKQRNSIYHAYPADWDNPSVISPNAKIKTMQNQVVLSATYKF